MSTENMTLEQLLNIQQYHIKEFHAAQHYAWQNFLKLQKELLAPCGGQLDLVHPDIKKEIQEMKREFDEEWGSKGRLMNQIKEQQKQERKEYFEQKRARDETGKDRKDENDREK